MDNSINIWILPVKMSQKTQSKLNLPRERLHSASQMLRRHALSWAVDYRISPGQWRFNRDKAGKPRVDIRCELPNIHFSCAHGKEAVCVATSFIGELGIDLECTQQSLPLDPTLFMSHEEQSRCAKNASTVQFIHLWTLKEAYAKMIAQGLNFDLSSITFSLDPPQLITRSDRRVQTESIHIEHRELMIRQKPYSLSLIAKNPPSNPIRCTYHILDEPWRLNEIN